MCNIIRTDRRLILSSVFNNYYVFTNKARVFVISNYILMTLLNLISQFPKPLSAAPPYCSDITNGFTKKKISSSFDQF